eukprot:CAMPEP_0197574058 /NCGR_PEP_ID=MMETSP1320-20131121/43273_1 /TAXON_ID=91990 /ORGANISM="Bolidomonas sp., Strain RCC2347" /LENGTH=168 /DNA_ID=CAMNT_0043136575 /DNA_START=540 /DNA_END=1043 /DNA_ORIENTATION=-
MSGFPEPTLDPITAMLESNADTILEMEDLVTSLSNQQQGNKQQPSPSSPKTQRNSSDPITLVTQDPLYKDRTSYVTCIPCEDPQEEDPPMPFTDASLEADIAAVLLANDDDDKKEEEESRRREELKAKFAPPVASRKDRTSYISCPPCDPLPPDDDDDAMSENDVDDS